MPEATLTTALFSTLYDAAIFIAPPLIIATLIAFLIGLFQAVTQIQEQTMAQTVKIIVIAVILMGFGGVLGGPLYATSDQLFADFYQYER